MTQLESMGFSGPVIAASVTPAIDGYIATYRGNSYSIHPTATPDAWTVLGEAIASGDVTPEPYVALPAPALDDLKAAQIAMLSASCQAQIYGGFSSSALGAAYTYPFKDLDQANLSASVTSSLLPGLAANWTTPFWCADSTAAWLMRPHTAVQIQKVGTDAMVAKLAAINKNISLAAQVNAATTVAAVQAIVW